MEPRGLAFVLVLAAVGLSGCIASDDGVRSGQADEALQSSALDAPSLDTAINAPAAGLSAAAGEEGHGAQPVWEVGDWWDYADSGQGGIATRVVVVGQSGPDYITAAADKEGAIYDALFDHFAIGRIDKATLGYRVSGQLTTLYDFPLFDNQTWTTGTPFGQAHMKVQAANVTTPKGTFDGFRITATLVGGTVFVYDYTDEVKHFSKVDVIEPDVGVVFTRQLRDFGTEYAGSYYVATTDLLLEETWTLAANGLTFDVAKAYEFLFLEVSMAITGAGGMSVIDPELQLAYNNGVLVGGEVDDDERLAPTQGTWQIGSSIAGDGEIEVEIRGVVVQDRTL